MGQTEAERSHLHVVLPARVHRDLTELARQNDWTLTAETRRALQEHVRREREQRTA